MYEYLGTLNDAQRIAATHIDGPLLMIAGAGSGKTTTLINRVAYMVDSGIDPSGILMLTFTNAAAANMVHKAVALSNKECAKITACTFHSFCALVLRKHGGAVGLSADFTIITPPEELEAIKLCKSRIGYSEDKEVLRAKEIAEAYSAAINFLCPLSDIFEGMGVSGERARKTAEVVNAYRSYKQENGFLTYDDLLLYMHKLLRIPEKRDALEKQYKYVCVDEYQDTNAIQERIAFLLTKKHGNLAVVGDDYQSIYRFRGADVSNIIEFEERARRTLRKETTKVVMDVNYRSVSGILDVANEVMAANADFGFPKTMRGVKCAAAKPELIRPENGEEEAKMVVAGIEEWMEDGNNLSEYAVLSRSSKGTSLIEVMLTKKGIPYEKLGGLKFLEHQCILDMLSFFKVFVNNSDELSWFHLLDIVPGVGEAYASSIVKNLKSGESISQWKTKRFYNDLSHMIAFVKGRQEHLAKSDMEILFDETKEMYFSFVEKKIRTARLRDEEKRAEMFEQMKSDEETVFVLRDMALSYGTLTQFLDSIVLDATPQVPTKESVVVSTIHSAKGLEWSHVDIVDCLLGMIPDDKSVTKEDLDEELRCLYVALTRAKDTLTLYAPFGLRSRGKFYSELCPYLESSMRRGLFYGCKSSPMEKTAIPAKVYLNVPYSLKDYAKACGARWDSGKRKWFCFDNNPKLGVLLKVFG